MKKMFTRCAVLAMGAVFATGCVGTLESPHMGSFDGVDKRGDQDGLDPRSDIDLWGVRYSPAQVELYLKPAVLGDPANDTNWTQRDSLITWDVETTNDSVSDFAAYGYLNTDGSYEVWVENSQGDETCAGTGSYNASREIALRLDPVACFGGRGPIRVQAWLDYEEVPGRHSVDEAPNSPAWSGWIAPAEPRIVEL